MQRLKRFLLILFVICACAACDQSTKHIASTRLALNKVSSYAGDIFRFHYIENKGAFLSLGDSLSDQQQFMAFTIIVSLILGVILIYTIFNTTLSTFSVVAYAIILGGGLSNLYDRIVNNGAVIDFLNIGIGRLRTGIFNIADVFIMTGLTMLLLHTYIHKKMKKTYNQRSH